MYQIVQANMPARINSDSGFLNFMKRF